MTTYTYRVEIDPATNAPLVWIDANGAPAIRQPHHPSAVLDPADPTAGLWQNEEQATIWATEYIAQIEAEQAAAAAQAEAETQAAEEDRARLVRIEEMLAQLLAK